MMAQYGKCAIFLISKSLHPNVCSKVFLVLLESILARFSNEREQQFIFHELTLCLDLKKQVCVIEWAGITVIFLKRVMLYNNSA